MEGRGGSSAPARCSGVSAVWAVWPVQASWLGAAAIAAIGLAMAGCGRGERPQPSGAPMGAERHHGEGENQPPVIQRLSLTPASPASGDTIRALATASDPDGDPVTVRYAWSVDGRALPETGPEISPGELGPGAKIEVVAVASDGHLESAPAQATATSPVPGAAIAGIELHPAPEVMPGDPVVAVAQLSGPTDGVELRYRWLLNDEPTTQAAERFDTKGLHRGDRIAVSVTPVTGDQEADTVRSIEVVVANSPPRITSQPQGAAQPDGSYRYEVKAEDPDGDTALRFRLDHAPDGMTIDPVLGVLTWRPTEAQTGHQEAELVVSDGRGGETHQKIEFNLKDSSGESGGSSAPASASDPERKGGTAPGEAKAPAGDQPESPVRYRRRGHPSAPSTPAAPAPGDEGEGDDTGE